jgi:hypothetical protein
MTITNDDDATAGTPIPTSIVTPTITRRPP